MEKPTQGLIESDEDYHRRIAREANERSVELATDARPVQGPVESDEGYDRRMACEASESEILLASGETPVQGSLESDAAYERRIAGEAREAVVAAVGESRPSQGLVESDDDDRRRLSREADEAAIERETGSRPSQGLVESDEAYRARIRQEACEVRAARELEQPAPEPLLPPLGSPASHDGDTGRSSAKRRVQLLLPPEPSPVPVAEDAAPPSRASSTPGVGSAAAFWLFVAAVVVIGLVAFWRGQSSSAAGDGPFTTAFVAAPGLNVRAGPSRQDAILLTLLRGDPVQVGGRDTRDPLWVRARVSGVEGWVNSRYLADQPPPAAPPPAPAGTVRPRVTLQYQAAGDRQAVDGVVAALEGRGDWRVGQPERVLPSGENRPEVYGGLRFYFEADSALARTVCTEVVAELARRGMTVTMPLWPMVTGQRTGRFNASPGLIEVWISPLPPAAPSPAPMGRCGR